MAPRYPRPVRQDPPQAGKFTPQPLPLIMTKPIEVENIPPMEERLPTFTAEDEVFLMKIGVWL